MQLRGRTDQLLQGCASFPPTISRLCEKVYGKALGNLSQGCWGCACAPQAKFVERQQALLHGDLHTGSLMVAPDATYAIDAEFACVGPIAFDVGKMVANLLIACFASHALQAPGEPRDAQRAWLLQVGPLPWVLGTRCVHAEASSGRRPLTRLSLNTLVQMHAC
jgi:hypothetical protein